MHKKNKEIMQEIFGELATGNSRPLVEALAEKCCWTVIGTTKWSKTYDGKSAILNELFAALRKKIRGANSISAHRFFAEGDHVVIEARGNNATNAGVAYNNSYCFVTRLAKGKLLEVTEYCDTDLVATVLGDPMS